MYMYIHVKKRLRFNPLDILDLQLSPQGKRPYRSCGSVSNNISRTDVQQLQKVVGVKLRNGETAQSSLEWDTRIRPEWAAIRRTELATKSGHNGPP